LFPIVQDQWLNIFLLNKNNISYYAILYYLSGLLFPLIIINYSSRNFLNYKFDSNNNESNKKEFKNLFYLISFCILLLSLIITNYFIFSFSLVANFSIYNNLSYLKIKILILIIIILLLLLNKTKRILKKLILINFFYLSIVIWSNHYFNLLSINDNISYYFSNIKLPELESLNIFNIAYLMIIEIGYYTWSFINNKNNISNWRVPYPSKTDLNHVMRITVFYFGILIYYLIFNRLN